MAGDETGQQITAAWIAWFASAPPKKSSCRTCTPKVFEPAPGQRVKEPGEDTDIGAALQRVLAEIDEIAEATLRSVSLETMLRATTGR